jgi:hypothetical protein
MSLKVEKQRNNKMLKQVLHKKGSDNMRNERVYPHPRITY